MRRSLLAILVLAIASPFITLVSRSAETDKEENLSTRSRQVFAPLPANMPQAGRALAASQVALGRLLFFDPRISVDGAVSCARCHQPSLYGTDALPRPLGAADRINPRNAPTILNAALQISAHWIGNRKDVEDQATQALIGPPSFGNSDYNAAMAKIKAIPGYLPLFRKAFPQDRDPVTPANWGTAIGAYERTLVTPSPFDDFLKGNIESLSKSAKSGLKDFMEFGCTACHNGAGVGGGMYAKFGITENYWKATGSKEIDKGRATVTGNSADLYMFKVPVLRNVAMTPPYFHDGSVGQLPQAVRIMSTVQFGRTLTENEVIEIVAFLDSLTGPLPESFAVVPTLPPGPFTAQ